MTMARLGDDVESKGVGLGMRSPSAHSPGSRNHSRSVSRSSGKEEHHFYHHARSESQVGMREDTEADVRIRSAGGNNSRPVEVEYETPNTVKGIWLGTYFFFSLMLTLYNKLILGSVCCVCPVGYTQRDVHWCRSGAGNMEIYRSIFP